MFAFPKSYVNPRRPSLVQINRELFSRDGVVAIRLLGGPSCGKTSILEATLKQLKDEMHIGAVVGNVRGERDADRLRKWTPMVSSVETPDMNAQVLREALGRLDLSKLDLLFIEHGDAEEVNQVDIGQAATVGLFSVIGGDAQVERHCEWIRDSRLLLLTKSDLIPFTPFDADVFRASVRSVKPELPILALSTVSHIGLPEWFEWLRELVRVRRPFARLPESVMAWDYFMG